MTKAIDCAVVVGKTAKTRKNSVWNSAAGRAILLLFLLVSLVAAAVTSPDYPETPEDDSDEDDDGGVFNTERSANVGNIEITPFAGSPIEMNILEEVAARRLETAESILKFPYTIVRNRCLTNVRQCPEWSKGVIYWMHREQRVQDNWALLYAQKLAIMRKVPLYVIFCKPNPFKETSLRQHKFMIEGLKKVKDDLRQLNIHFIFSCGSAEDIITDFAIKYKCGAVVLDFLPLREHTRAAMQIARPLKNKVPVIMVDAHNVIPCWSHNRTESQKTKTKDDEYKGFLSEFPPVIKHPFNNSQCLPESIGWEESDKYFKIDRGVLPVLGIGAGYENGILEFEKYLRNRLKPQGQRDDIQFRFSYLSPWLHFGHVSGQRVILELRRFAKTYLKAVSSFMSESYKRRERSDLYCYRRPRDYDRLTGAPEWAKRGIEEQRKVIRMRVYSKVELENARTNDRLWNAVQIQMITEGTTHRLLRMYWTKKVLEWTDTPEIALSTAIYLNNKFSLDGNDPRIYNGCMYAICGFRFRLSTKSPKPKIKYSRLPWYQANINTETFIENYNTSTLASYRAHFARES